MSVTTELAPAAQARTDAGARWRGPLIALLAAELFVLFAPTMWFLYQRWTVSVWHNVHGMFVLPLAAWLAWPALKERRDRPAAASAWGFAFLVPALALHALDAGMHTELLSAAALLLTLPGLALLLLGADRTRTIAFPLFFTVFALPIPLGITEILHLVLRQITVAATTAVLPLLGVSVLTEGTTLHLTRGTLEVADACSGFSTLYAAMAVATLAAYGAASTLRRAVVLVAAAPIAMASNVVRVVVLVLLVQTRGMDVLHTPLHPLSGMLTFALSLPLIFWLGGPVAQRGAQP